MRFDCGPDWKEKHDKLEAKKKRLAEWHPWFAWYPVRVGNHDCRWLEYVNRRMIWDTWGWNKSYLAIH